MPLFFLTPVSLLERSTWPRASVSLRCRQSAIVQAGEACATRLKQRERAARLQTESDPATDAVSRVDRASASAHPHRRCSSRLQRPRTLEPVDCPSRSRRGHLLLDLVVVRRVQPAHLAPEHVLHRLPPRAQANQVICRHATSSARLTAGPAAHRSSQRPACLSAVRQRPVQRTSAEPSRCRSAPRQPAPRRRRSMCH